MVTAPKTTAPNRSVGLGRVPQHKAAGVSPAGVAPEKLKELSNEVMSNVCESYLSTVISSCTVTIMNGME